MCLCIKEKLKQIHHYFGLVFQNFNLFPHYSVLKNIMDAPVSVDKVPKEEAKKRARKLMEQLGLSERKMLIRTSFPADSSSVYRSQEHWRCSRRSCFSMNRQVRWIRS